jgi:hypothetical protein
VKDSTGTSSGPYGYPPREEMEREVNSGQEDERWRINAPGIALSRLLSREKIGRSMAQ